MMCLQSEEVMDSVTVSIRITKELRTKLNSILHRMQLADPYGRITESSMLARVTSDFVNGQEKQDQQRKQRTA